MQTLFALFVLPFAYLGGDPTLFAKLQQSASPEERASRVDAAPKTDSADEAALWEAILAFEDTNTSRRQLSAMFRDFAKRFPESKFEAGARDSITILERMIREDDDYLTKKPPLQVTTRDEIADLIFKLRDQTGRQDTQPGECNFFAKHKNTPAHRLVAIGYEAVPQLIEALDDERFTRAVQFHRYYYFSHCVLRIGDCAHDVLFQITGNTFSEGTERWDGNLVQKGRAKAAKERAKKWWQEYQKKGEKLMLIEGTEKGNWNSIRQAEMLAKKYPKEAGRAVAAGVYGSKDATVRKELMSVLCGLKDDKVIAYLRTEMQEGPFFHPKVLAACELFSRNREEGLEWLVQKWAAQCQNRKWEDGWIEMAQVLCASRRLEIIRSIRANIKSLNRFQKKVIILCFDSDRCARKPFREETPEVQREINKMLAELLEDTHNAGLAFGGPGEKVAKPRICDLAAHCLALRRGRPELFDFFAERREQDEMIEVIKETDRGKQ